MLKPMKDQRKNQKTKLQDALDLYFLIPDENEDLVTERIIRLLSVGFERLLAFNWGYAFNGSTNKYYLISRIDEIISIVNQNKLFTIEQLEKQFTIPEELEFASGYVSQQRESRYYDLLSTTLNEIGKFHIIKFQQSNEDCERDYSAFWSCRNHGCGP